MDVLYTPQKPYASVLTNTGVIEGDSEIEQVEIRGTLKPGLKAVSSTIHGRAVALWLAQHHDYWLKYCITNKMERLG